MKKICLVLLLILPGLLNAQKSTTTAKVANTEKEPEKTTTKYEDIVSKSGVVFTTYTYPMGETTLVWNESSSSGDKLAFFIDRIIFDNLGVSFLRVHLEKYGGISIAKIEEANVKELYSSLLKMKEICKNTVPDGAKATYSYFNDDGVSVRYEGDVWKIKLEE